MRNSMMLSIMMLLSFFFTIQAMATHIDFCHELVDLSEKNPATQIKMVDLKTTSLLKKVKGDPSFVLIYNKDDYGKYHFDNSYFITDSDYDFSYITSELGAFFRSNFINFIIYRKERIHRVFDILSLNPVNKIENPISIPEPGPMLLLGAGLIGIAAIGRHKLFKRGEDKEKTDEGKKSGSR